MMLSSAFQQGRRYLIPKSVDEAKRSDSLCQGTGIDFEDLVPTLLYTLSIVMDSNGDEAISPLQARYRKLTIYIFDT
jgi:hypothetical protein